MATFKQPVPDLFQQPIVTKKKIMYKNIVRQSNYDLIKTCYLNQLINKFPVSHSVAAFENIFFL